MFVVETVENAQPAEAAGACVRFFNRKRKAKKEGLLAGKLQCVALPHLPAPYPVQLRGRRP